MIAATKRTARRLATVAPVSRVWRRLSAHLARIVAYHRFRDVDDAADDALDVAILRRQLRHICRHYHVVRLEEIGQLLACGATPRPRTVAITVDDGHASFARRAWPIFREFGVPVTLFVVSALTEAGGWLWTDQFEYLCAHVPDPDDLSELKRMSPTARDARLHALAQRAGLEIPARPPEKYALLSWSDLRELAGTGLVDIGSHTRTHPVLSTVTDDQAAAEIVQSREELQSRLGSDVTCFCYPNGLRGDYGQRETELIRQAGYCCATASHMGYISEAADPCALPRIGGVADWSTFSKYLDGLEYVQQCWSARGAASGLPSI